MNASIFFILTASVLTFRSSKGTFTSANLKLLKEGILQQKDIKGLTPVFAKTEKPLQNNGMNTSYLLVGAGVAMSVLFFIIVIEIYKKCGGTKRTSELRNKVGQYSDENFKQQRDETSYQMNRFNFQQYNVHVNNETGQCKDIIPPSDHTNSANDLKAHIFPLKFRESVNL